ncbi:electron transport complex subunit RsxC [bacterium]|nr:electron transport complex subunit RsxC [bacterium]MBU1599570.1 electron transport complex subunit RsxC [bacterium]
MKGGIHFTSRKELTRDKKIQALPLPEVITIPLSQHLGLPAKPVVKTGDKVKTGQVIGEPDGQISSFVHATISGRVKSIGPASSPTGRRQMAITIESDGKDEWVELSPLSKTREAMIEAIFRAGVVGLGGAGFPSQIKLSPPKQIDTLILNGAECEPYLTSDYRTMVEEPEGVIGGLKIIAQIIQPKRVCIAIERDKNLAASTLAQYDGGIEIIILPVCYPQGGEKQLIKAITGREVPSGGLPMDVGTLVHNVNTARAIYEAVTLGKPLIEKAVTVTGEVARPKNLRARIGTHIRLLLDECGAKGDKVIMGGPMMGLAQWDMEVPVVKTTTGLVVLKYKEEKESVCIWCGRCIGVCPMGLLPVYLSGYLEKKMFSEAKADGLLDCIECGCCAYICPARRPIVHLIKLGKIGLKKLK